jgi:hypothetical protein
MTSTTLQQGFFTFMERIQDLLLAPFRYPDMIWIVIPLLIIIVLMTLYFARYKEEELGWNTALGNSLILIFVSINLLQHIYFRNGTGPENFFTYPGPSILAGLLFLEGILLLFVNFSHGLPKSIAYFFSSPLTVNLTAYLAIAIVYSNLPVDFTTLLAAAFVFAFFLLAFTSIGFLARRWWVRVEHMKVQEKVKDIKKERKTLQKTKRLVKVGEQKIKKAESKEKKEVKKKQSELKKVRQAMRKNPTKKKHPKQNKKRT